MGNQSLDTLWETLQHVIIYTMAIVKNIQFVLGTNDKKNQLISYALMYII